MKPGPTWGPVRGDCGPGCAELLAALLTEPDLLDKAVLLAARQMAEPAWPQDVWERERAPAGRRLCARPTPARHRGGQAFAAAVYGNHPYGQRPTEATLARIQLADMQQFHARHVDACRARVHIVGAVQRAQARLLVAALLARLPTSDPCAALPAIPKWRRWALRRKRTFPLPRPRPRCSSASPVSSAATRTFWRCSWATTFWAVADLSRA